MTFGLGSNPLAKTRRGSAETGSTPTARNGARWRAARVTRDPTYLFRIFVTSSQPRREPDREVESETVPGMNDL